MRLLLVEDDTEFSKLIGQFLEREEFITRVDYAFDGITAKILLEDFRYDVVLTDYDLGGHFKMNGLEVVYVAKYESRIPAPVTILWSGINREREILYALPDERPEFAFTKNQIDEVLSQLRSINDEINERVV